MGIRKLFQKTDPNLCVQTARQAPTISQGLDYLPLSPPEAALYDQLRSTLPILDAAILKIIRLTGDFALECDNPTAQRLLDDFCYTVPVGTSQRGLFAFVQNYLDSLLTYGNAVGEIVLSRDNSTLAGLYSAPLGHLEIKAQDSSPFTAQMYVRQGATQLLPVPKPELVLFSALNPKPGNCMGNSILAGLPFMTSILLKIYESVYQNFDRVGNLRYAVTYNPAANGDRAHAKDIAESIAKEWSSAMSSNSSGTVKDFVAVGDVQIKVIGAENQMMDIQVPVRQILEQVVAKLGLPPFLLGLSWSSTERMSRQQADILTSELESYRHILTPVILKICRLLLRLNGYTCQPRLRWSNISLLDETELANARLANARAEELEVRTAMLKKELATVLDGDTVASLEQQINPQAAKPMVYAEEEEATL